MAFVSTSNSVASPWGGYDILSPAPLTAGALGYDPVSAGDDSEVGSPAWWLNRPLTSGTGAASAWNRVPAVSADNASGGSAFDLLTPPHCADRQRAG